MKKLSIIFLAFLAISPLLAERILVNDVVYDVNSDNKTAMVDSVSTNYTALTIPSSIIHDGITYAVTSIGDRAVEGCEGLKEITIPKTVTSIGDEAFVGCVSLITITIPKSVTILKKGVFAGCESLTTITIPKSIKSIGNGAFSDCYSLTTITIVPNSKGELLIGNCAFAGCESLMSITIPKHVKGIDNYAFGECISLESIVYKGTKEEWSSLDKKLTWNNGIPATYVQCKDGHVRL